MFRLGRTYLNLKSTLNLVHSLTIVNFCTNNSRIKRNLWRSNPLTYFFSFCLQLKMCSGIVGYINLLHKHNHDCVCGEDWFIPRFMTMVSSDAKRNPNWNPESRNCSSRSFFIWKFEKRPSTIVSWFWFSDYFAQEVYIDTPLLIWMHRSERWTLFLKHRGQLYVRSADDSRLMKGHRFLMYDRFPEGFDSAKIIETKNVTTREWSACSNRIQDLWVSGLPL